MRIVSAIGLILDMSSRDCDTTFPLLGSLVNSAIFEKVCKAFFGLSLRNRSCEGGFAVVDMADCAFKTLAADFNFGPIEYYLTDVYVRFATLENSSVVPRRRNILGGPFFSQSLLHRTYAASPAQCSPAGAEESLRECRHRAMGIKRRKERRWPILMMDCCRPSKNPKSIKQLPKPILA